MSHIGRPLTAARRVALALGMAAVLGIPVFAGPAYASTPLAEEQAAAASAPAVRCRVGAAEPDVC